MQRLHLALLGSFQATLDDEQPIHFRSSKDRALLAFLAVEADKPHDRTALAALLWPETSDTNARSNLRFTLSSLRHAIGDHDAEPAYLIVRPESIQFNAASSAWVDLHELERGLPQGQLFDAAMAEAALRYVRGPLLAGFALDDCPEFEQWLLIQRERINRQVLACLGRLANYYEHRHEYERALPFARQQVELEPWDEAANRQLMRLLAFSGRRSEALAQYESLGLALEQELAVEPEAETDRLAAEIRANRLRPESALMPGSAIRGFELGERISSGPMGELYRAHQPGVGRDVAIKVLRPGFVDRPEFIRRFEQEARLIARLEHPHIVPLYDYWREPGGAFLVMRWLPGGSLADSLPRGPWHPEAAVRLVLQVGAALYLAHQSGVIHCGIKPTNILLDDAGNGYLADFGIATLRAPLADEGEQAPTLPAAATPDYAYTSPELLDGDAPTPASDIYSLGMVLFALLSGQAPVVAPHPSPLHSRADLPPALDAVVQQATARQPQDRFADALTFGHACRQALQPGTARLPAEGQEDADLPNPYKGLRAFEETDQADFFGRRALVDHVLACLALPEPSARFLALVGPSGSGKSSLLRAGLAPRLLQGALPGSAQWYVQIFMPGAAPFERLAAALLHLSPRPLPDLAERLRRSEACLEETVDAILPDGAELCLIVDQFEELYTAVADPDERERFLHMLVMAVSAPCSRIRLILGLRADFYDRPLTHPDLSRLLQGRTEVIVPLTTAEFTEAIEGPARRVGVTLQEGLTATLVAAVNEQPGALPFLQYALTELFQRRTGRLLTHAAYQAIGGVNGALAQQAEATFLGLEPAARSAARQIFLRLVALQEDGGETRRRVLQSELLAAAGESPGRLVLDAFDSRRLLSFDREPTTRQPTVEVAHEALLRAWDRLRGWLDDSRADLRWQLLLARSSAEWIAGGHEPSLLLHGSRLSQLAEWAEATDLALTGDEAAYLQASLAERTRQATEEAARQARERALEQKSRNRLRAIAGVLTLATLVALGLSLFAWRQRNDALRAYSLSLTANALEALDDGDPATALALALVATGIDDPPPLARQALLEAAYAPGPRRRYDVAALFAGEQSPATALAFAPDGHSAYIGFANGVIIDWDWEHEREIARVAAHSAPINALIAAPDGRSLFSAADDGLIVQVDLGTARIARTLAGHSGAVRSIDLSRDGRLLVSGGIHGDDLDAPGELFLWDLTSGETIRRFDGNIKGIVQARFVLKDSGILASSGDLRVFVDQGGSSAGGILSDLLLWKVDGDSRVSLLDNLGHDAQVITPLDGDALVLIGSYYDNVATLFDLSGPRVVRQLSGHGDAVTALAAGADRKLALSGSDDRSLIMWDLATGQPRYQLQGHTGPVTGVAVTPDARVALSLSSNGELIRWDLHDAMDVRHFVGHKDMVYDVALLPGGAQLVSASGSPSPAVPSADTSLRLWEIASGREIAHQAVDAPVIFQVAASPDGKLILANNLLFDAATLAPRGQLEGHAEGEWITALAISPDSSRALTASTDGTLILWDLGSRRLLCRIDPGIPGGLWSAAFSADGQAALTESAEGFVGLWDLSDCSHVRDYGADMAPALDMNDAIFHPDGQSVFGAAGDGYIYQFERESGRLLRSFGPHDDIRTRMGITPDGKLLLSSGMDGVLRLWDLQSGLLVRRFGAPDTVIFDVTIAADGRTAFVGSSDRTIVQWALVNPSPTELRDWIRANREVRTLTCAERILYDVKPLCEQEPKPKEGQ
jgi:WD40 repeat protein/serine/threonine protein kinase/DNA-binding SARP family transcriptional activator